MAVKIKNRHQLKTKEITEIIQELQKTYHRDFFDKQAMVETGDLEGYNVILVNDDVDFFRVEVRILITIRAISKYTLSKGRVIVDMGAIKFITNGADIMAAGIVDADPDIQENDPVWICDETHHKALAVGIAVFSGAEMMIKDSGKAVKNFHYVGDMLWNLTRINP